MAIKFECPVCGNHLSAGENYTGKEGKCKCGAAVIVPGDTDRMKFGCRHCGKGISVSNRHAGKKAKCPSCQGIISVPLLGHLIIPEEPFELLPDTPETTTSDMIQATCLICKTTSLFPATSAGNLVECDKCGGFVEVPSQQSQTESPKPEQKEAPSAPPIPCPSCEQKVPSGAPVCTRCGIYIKSGRPILTAWDVDADELEEKAEGVVSAVSWLIPFGLYPVYSDAMGDHKPYATWGITAVTVLISFWFLLLGYTDSPRMMSAKNLMLWGGKADPDVEYIHMLYDYTNYGDADAFIAKRQELSDTLPEDEVDIAALNALTPEQKCFGEYRFYQLLTHAFLHGGIMHLAGNMLFLLVLGSRVNSSIGNILTIILYPILGIAAALTHLASMGDEPPTALLGASGAVMGLAGAYFLLFPIHKVYMVIWMRWGLLAGFHLSFKCFALRGFWVVLFYIMFDVIAVSFTMESTTAHWAHIGGFVTGMLIAFGLLVGRLAYSRSDMLSLILGKYAWKIFGTPAARLK